MAAFSVDLDLPGAIFFFLSLFERSDGLPSLQKYRQLLSQNKKLSPETWISLALVKQNCGLNNTAYSNILDSCRWNMHAFMMKHFCFHNLLLVKVKLKLFLKADNQRITAHFQSPPAPKRSSGHQQQQPTGEAWTKIYC